MLKRSRRAYTIVFIKSVACLFTISLSLCFYACGYYTVDRISDYENFLRTYTKYSATPSDPSDDNKSPNETNKPSAFDTISGFYPLYDKLFSYGTRMDGGMAFVKTDMGNGILSASGTLLSIEKDLSEIELYGDLYVSCEDNLYGVNDVFGNRIISPLYDSIQIVGHTVLAIKGNTAFVFENGDPTGKSIFHKNVSLLSEAYIYKDNLVYSTTFILQEVNGCPYLDVPSEGIVAVSCNGKSVAYADVVTGKILAGTYREAKQFSDGCGIAVTENDESVVINRDGDIIYATHTNKILSKSGIYYCFLRHNRYGIMDSDFQEITAAEFAKVRYEKAVEHYIIVGYGKGERLYDLQTKKYVGETYDRIEYKDGLFFNYSADATEVLNSDLQLLVRCKSAVWNENILTVHGENGVAYYTRRYE